MQSVEDVLDIMTMGTNNRAIASTRCCSSELLLRLSADSLHCRMNDESSRSHSVFLIHLGQRNQVRKLAARLVSHLFARSRW